MCYRNRLIGIVLAALGAGMIISLLFGSNLLQLVLSLILIIAGIMLMKTK